MKRMMNTILFVGAVFSVSLTAHTKDVNKQAKVVPVKVTNKGFVPSSIEVEPGTPLTLKVTRTTDKTCAKKITVADTDISLDLPLNKPVNVEIGALEKGEVKFGCGMNRMVGGVILVN